MNTTLNEEFAVSLSNIEYEGPLSILLDMIKRSEKNIYEISILDIINQFIDFFKKASSLNLDTTGDFLVMASDFHVFKSRMLLPHDMDEEVFTKKLEFEIVQQMLEFQKYKMASDALESLEDNTNSIIERKDLKRVNFQSDEKEKDNNDMAWSDVKLYDLIYAFAKVIYEPESDLAVLSKMNNFHIDDAIEMIKVKLTETKYFSFTKLFRDGITKRELITFFLAILEMVREKNILLKQDIKFADIYLFKREE